MAPGPSQRGLSDALRNAVERTFAITGGSAGDTRERATELVDQVLRQGEKAREALTEKVGNLRVPSREEFTRVEAELSSVVRRLERIEATLRRSDAG